MSAPGRRDDVAIARTRNLSCDGVIDRMLAIGVKGGDAAQFRLHGQWFCSERTPRINGQPPAENTRQQERSAAPSHDASTFSRDKASSARS